MKYIVKEKDNLLSIADQFGIELDDLIKENNLEYIYSLEPGIELVINNGDDISLDEDKDEYTDTNNSLFSYYIVVKGDNLSKIGKRYNISPKVLADINGIGVDDIIYPEQQIMIPREGKGLYITKDGDTIQSISDELGILPEDILIENKNVYVLPEQLIVYRQNIVDNL